jgi:hypothetical protein
MINSISRTPAAVLLALLLSGCGELYVLGAVAVTAPIWVPIEYGVSQSKVKQPVEVVNWNGKSLTPAFEGEPEAKLVVPKDAVICTSDHRLGKNSQNDLIYLECNKGLKGRLDFDGLTTSKAIVTVGPKSAPQNPDGYLSETRQRCSGNFNKKKDVVAPFLLECDAGRFGVISPKSADPNAKGFTVWLPAS